MFLRDNTVEEFGNVDYEEIQYGVDAEVAFTLLTKLYTNPKKIIPQEYLCNARDAMREAGNTSDRVRVVLPEYTDNNLYIRDYGPGLTKDRIEKVFCTLGKSTKRSNGLQTGGFGIGAKCYFAYGNSFIVKSFVDGVLTTYASVKNGRKVSFRTISEEDTTEKNGVEVVLPIELSDVKEFELNALQTSKHWKDSEKPRYFHQDEEVSTVPDTPTEIGLNTYLVEGECSSFKLKILVDGILYPIDYSLLSGAAANKLSNFTKKEIIINVGASELTVNPNRETLEVNEENIETIELLCQNVYDTITKDIDVVLSHDFKEEVLLFSAWMEVEKWFNVKNPTSFNKDLYLGEMITKINGTGISDRFRIDKFRVRDDVKSIFHILRNSCGDKPAALYSKARRYLEDNIEVDYLLLDIRNSIVEKFCRKTVHSGNLQKQAVVRVSTAKRTPREKKTLTYQTMFNKKLRFLDITDKKTHFYIPKELYNSAGFEKYRVWLKEMQSVSIIVLNKSAIKRVKNLPNFKKFTEAAVNEDSVFESYLWQKNSNVLRILQNLSFRSKDCRWQLFDIKYQKCFGGSVGCSFSEDNIFLSKELRKRMQEGVKEILSFEAYLKENYGLIFQIPHYRLKDNKDIHKYINQGDQG